MSFPKNKLTYLSVLDNDHRLWYGRLGHASLVQLNKLALKNCYRTTTNLYYDKVCDACVKDNHVRSSLKSKVVSTSRPLELFNMDLWDPMRVMRKGGKRYILMEVDDYTRYTWILFISSRYEVFDFFHISQNVSKETGSSTCQHTF